MAEDLLNITGDEQLNDQVDDNGKADGQDDKQTGSDNKAPENTVTLSAENWKDFIPQELKDRSEWSRVNNFSDLFNNYIQQGQTISKSVRLPDDSFTAEQINAFYQKLGKPVDKSGYAFEYTKAKEEYVYDKDSFDFSVFQEAADSANLTAKQYEQLAKAYLDIQNENYLNYQEEFDTTASKELRDAEAELKKKWGNNYNNYINAISQRLEKSYPKETLDRMANAGLFRDAAFLDRQLTLTKMQTGDTLFIDGNVVTDVPQTIESLRAQRDELMEQDYVKNKAQVQQLNEKIARLKLAQKGQVARSVLQ